MTEEKITRVWLDEKTEDCTMCGLCENTCPKVFKVPVKMTVLPDADLTEIELIKEAAECCPVSVIAIEYNNSGVRDNKE